MFYFCAPSRLRQASNIIGTNAKPTPSNVLPLSKSTNSRGCLCFLLTDLQGRSAIYGCNWVVCVDIVPVVDSSEEGRLVLLESTDGLVPCEKIENLSVVRRSVVPMDTVGCVCNGGAFNARKARCEKIADGMKESRTSSAVDEKNRARNVAEIFCCEIRDIVVRGGFGSEFVHVIEKPPVSSRRH